MGVLLVVAMHVGSPAETPRRGHFLGQSRLYSLFGLRLGADDGLAKSTSYSRRLIVTKASGKTSNLPCWRDGNLYVTI